MKKIIVLTLVMLLCFTSVCFAADAAETETKEEQGDALELVAASEAEKDEAETAEELGYALEELDEIVPETDEEGFSLQNVVDSLNESNYNFSTLFDLIADLVDIASGSGGTTQAGNIIRAVGDFVSALIKSDESAVSHASGDLIREMILDEESLSSLTSGTILDIYEACRNELVNRGIIDVEE